ncbi:hypothetical protein LEN26_002118 [Aphanomyces euteiches]|nr:hypothetical protein AeMF1_011233 [Aphanomyces euteiches]KAH9159898.1 hypothetical protein LEN26_002118 [Aphanomyces euteiches]KAH9184781.1 hypothetical protein AeNC1_013244 [Aphanomyces euteiches]
MVPSVLFAQVDRSVMDPYQPQGGGPSGNKRHLSGGESDFQEQKRFRQEEGQPSRSILVRGLPNDCLESELLALVGPFATVEKCVMTPSKNEALVQLPDLDSATNLVNFYQSRDALVRGQKVFFAYSSHREENSSIPASHSSSGPPPSSHAPSSHRLPHHNDRNGPPSRSYERNNGPPPSSRNRPPPSYNDRNGPYDRNAPVSGFDRQPRHDRGPPPSSFDRGAPPPASYDRGGPSYDRGPSAFDRAPPSYDRGGPPPSSYDRNAPPYNDRGGAPSYPAQQPPPQSYGSGFDRAPPVSAKNTILMVTVSKMDYPVNVDVLHQVFSKYGTVMKIVTFMQREEFKSLVQLQTTAQAEAAQAALDGRDIYTGCNTLHIQMSTHKSLNVQYNNDKMRDFFNPNLPTHDPSDKDAVAASRGMLGDMPPPQRASGFSPAMNPMHQQQPPPRRDFGPPYAGGPPPQGAYGGDIRRGRSRSRERRSRSRDRDLGGISQTRSSVLICSNMDPHYVKVHSLFTIFGCFGDVLRIKVMFRKSDTALIQFVDERHAASAREHTDGLILCNKKLRVDFSKHTMVVMPRPDADTFEIQNTRDFTNTPYHRYRKRSLAEVCPPTTLLHISGIPVSMQLKPGDTVSNSRLLSMFAEWGVVKKYHPIAKQPKMVLLEMGTLEEAIDAMIALDNYTFNDGRIRVSFSKSFQRQQF